jgi:hypothetical protein
MASVSKAVSGVLNNIESKNNIVKEVLGLEINLAGVTFNDIQNKLAKIDIRSVPSLVRDIDNKYDSNAVSVEIPGSYGHIGYIPKKYSSSVAKLLDDGRNLDVKIERIVGGDYGNNYGVVIKLSERA